MLHSLSIGVYDMIKQTTDILFIVRFDKLTIIVKLRTLVRDQDRELRMSEDDNS